MTSHEHRSRNASPQFRSIKAVFEHADVPAPRPFSRASRPQTPTNDEPSPVASLISRETVKHQQETIDSLLEAPPTRHLPESQSPLRPRSSWIGPPPPVRSTSSTSAAAMARKVTITYSSPGLQPPVYITTSLSEPQWDLLEMGCVESPSGEWEFSKTFSAVVEGEYQYKFRLGPGNWWVCDESKPTVDDGFGDRNNVLVVEEEVPVERQFAEPRGIADHSAIVEPPTLPHERNSASVENKRDSLGADVVREKHAPLFSHEQDESAHATLEVPPEDVPVNFSRQDTLELDDDEGDREPSHLPAAPIFSHEKDVLPARTPTPDTDEDEDYMDQPPLMRHETLSSESGKSSHDIAEAENHSYFPNSPTYSHSSAPSEVTDSHVPAEADPSDPSLLRLDVLSSTSPIVRSVSHSSQPQSLPSVREDEEELEDDPAEEYDSSTHGTASGSRLHELGTGLPILAERPAALMTPPRTPDESKIPQSIVPDHHHKPAAQKDMEEEAKHDVKHHDSRPAALELPTAETSSGPDGDAGPSQSTKTEPREKRTANKAEKKAGERSSRSSIFETALGLSLFVVVGVGAAWLAFMMQDPIKDGGAALSGAS